METLKNFGVDPIQIVAQIVNFLIILFILKKFFFKKILDALENRKQSVAESIKQIEEAKRILIEAEARDKELLAKTQLETNKILEDTKKQRENILVEAELTAKKQAQKILDETREQIAVETRKAQKDLSLQVSNLAVEFLKKSASQLFNKEDQEKLIKSAIVKIKKRVD